MIGRIRFYGVGEKMFRRLVAVVLVGQGFAFFFGALVAWALNRSDPGQPASAYLAGGIALAVVTVLASGLLRRPWGITVGWLLQLVGLAVCVVLPAMLVVAVVFLALWVTALVQGDKMDELTRNYTPTDGDAA